MTAPAGHPLVQQWRASGREISVVGLGKSGVSATLLLRSLGLRVYASDTGTGATYEDWAGLLRDAGAAVDLGGHDLRRIARSAAVVVAPGVPPEVPPLAAAREAGLEIYAEVDLGFLALGGTRCVGITGTNGKTTTTALSGALLGAESRPVLVGGNIGTPLAAHALEFAAEGVVVAEVSSFQLETIETFRPRVAAVLNITPDHLDRHHTFEAYVDAKARIFMNQMAGDWAVLNADDEPTRALAVRTAARVLWFSRLRPVDEGVFVRDGWVVARLDGRVADVCPVSEIRLRGQHNVENVLAATACALRMGQGAESIRRVIGSFKAVAHRIEFVRDVDGVHVYNHSKGTNVASTIKALESFPERVVLIAGGKGKGQDFAPLAAAARGRVAHAVVIGEDGDKVAAALERAGIAVSGADSMPAAIDAALAVAQQGDVVLLSPACASFDMFDNYEHRGDVFKRLVESLA
jgi:UDP-N-acetylmuramoylalanine--D-glutamate ligase